MCGLCGTLGGEDHWTAAGAIGAGEQTRRAERLGRVRAANAVLRCFALRLDDFQGASFVLSSATGAQELVTTLPAVWEAARRLRGAAIDPLAPDLLDRLAG